MSGVGGGEEDMKAFAQLHDHLTAYTDTMVLRCAVQLGIPDAIRRRTDSAALSDLAAALSADPARLRRILRILLRMGLLTKVTRPGADGQEEERYGLTRAGEFLLTSGADDRENPTSAAHIVLAMTDGDFMRAWAGMGAAVFGVAPPFEAEHGCGVFEAMARRPEWGAAFNRGLAAEARMVMPSVIAALGGDGGCGTLGPGSPVGSLVDVGGGAGAAAAWVAEAFPHVRCSVLEMAHVVEENGSLLGGGVHFIPGDMFTCVPHADAVMLKRVLHDWGDEECLRILERCKEAIPKEGGVVIIVELVLDDEKEEEDMFSKWKQNMDMLMMVCFGGKERTLKEWDALLSRAGLYMRRVTPAMRGHSVIEACPII